MEEESLPPNYIKGRNFSKLFINFLTILNIIGKWKPRTDDEDYPRSSQAKEKTRIETEYTPPANYTKGKWKPKPPVETNIQPSTSKHQIEREIPEENYSKGKWIPTSTNETKSSKKITDNSFVRKSSGSIQYWCNPCNRRLASKIVYERHLKSELHFKRTSRDREFDDTDELSLMTQTRRTKPTPPEHIFSNQDTETQNKKRKRKKQFIKCEVCHSKVKKFMIGKHLISHYHCRKGDIKSETAKSMVLENIHGKYLFINISSQLYLFIYYICRYSFRKPLPVQHL